jgi:hypothetical protein
MARSGILLCWKEDDGMKVSWWSLGIVGAMVFALCSCSRFSPHYCEAEGRVIPEEEWKVRALMAVRKHGEQHLSQNMRDLLMQKLPNGGSDAQVQKVLTDYVRRVPLCCQIDYELSNIWWEDLRWMKNHPTTQDEYKDYNWAANLLVYAGDEDKFKFIYIPKKYEESRPVPGVTLPTVAGLNACGDKAIMWYRG